MIHYYSALLDMIKKVLTLDDKIKAIANELYEQKSLLVMGRGFNYATCLEGALVSRECLCSMFKNNLMQIDMIMTTEHSGLCTELFLSNAENQGDHLHALRGHPGR